MSSTLILAIIIGVLLIIIITLLLTGGRGNNRDNEPDTLPPANNDKFNTTFTPNSAANKTAPLEKGRKKNKKAAPFVNETQLSTAGKDETFLPQTASTSHEAVQDDDDQAEALTETQPRK